MTNISRRHWLIGTTAATFGLAASLLAQDVATLGETLKAKLKCRRDSEKAYVDQVVGLVNTGKLSRELVLNTMTYAIGQRADIPFPYFQVALRMRAAKIGVTI